MSRVSVRKWMWMLAFAVAWLALRVFWLDGDSGICSMWEYGFHATDEGYYLGGGKEKFLWGCFNDLVRQESPTYGYSTGMHWLSYLSYLLFGLSDWMWRLPFVVLAFAAWCLAYRHAAVRCGDRVAFPLVLALSCVPMTVSYERTACNDVLIGALSVITYCLSCGRGKWRLVVPPLLIGYIAVVKPSVWLLLPFFAAGVLDERKTSRAWIDLVVFFAMTAVAMALGKAFQFVSVMPETTFNGCSAAEILKRTVAHYAPPSLLDFGPLFRGLSAFPRDPSCKMLSAVAALISIVPGAMAARAFLLRKWTRRLFLYVTFPAYVAAVSIMNTLYTHYFIPVMMMLPILWTEVMADLSEEKGTATGWKRVIQAVVLPAAVLGVMLIFVFSQMVRPQDVQSVYSRIYNLPADNVWGFTWPWLLAICAVTVVTLTCLRGVRAFVREGAGWTFLAFAGGSVALAALPAVHFAPYFKAAAADYSMPLILNLLVSFAFLMLCFGFAPSPERRKLLAGFVPAVVILSYALTPAWRQAAGELLKPVTHVNAEVGAEIAKMVPPNAVVVGERATRVLMGQPIRTATTILSNDDPIPSVKAMLARDPKVPLFALADSQHAYNLQHYQKHPEVCQLQMLKKFSMPSFGTGKPADVYFCRIVGTPPKN